MALVTYKRSSNISEKIGKVITDQGYIDISESPFLGSIVNAVEESLTESYNDIYEIAANVDIGRATGEYLDRWGTLLGEDRGTIGYAKDLTLDNVYIQILPTANAGVITVNGGPIRIPKGSILHSEDNTYSVVTLDTTFIRANRNRTFARVIASNPGRINIPPGSITEVDLPLSSLDNITPGSAASYTLKAMNTRPISGGSEPADDTLFQYILQESAHSIGVFNERKINTLIDITEIRNVALHSFRGGVNVFIETLESEVNQAIVEIANYHLDRIAPKGTPVSVHAPITRYLNIEVSAEFTSTDSVSLTEGKQQLASRFAENVSTAYMGSMIDLQGELQAAYQNVPQIRGAQVKRATLGGRKVMSNTIAQHFNEKVILTSDRVTIS